MEAQLSVEGRTCFGMLSVGMTNADVTREDVIAMFETLRTTMFPGIGDDEAALILRTAVERHGVTVSEGSILETEFDPWYDEDRRAETEWHYWSRYRRHISVKLPPEAVESLDRTTDRIIERSVDPLGTGQEDRRGMGLGDVQSGKTAHYTGLISKAADLGYKVFVIIAGIHENLRSQTQDRIDEGFCGWLSGGPVKGTQLYGVGLERGAQRASSFTNTQKDFRKAAATNLGIPLRNLRQPVVFVVKKNARVLKTLIEWLGSENRKAGRERIDEAMMLIDDEADNASINIAKGADEVSRINGHIRQLLTMFERRTYCAYTATPFANIFIEPRAEHDEFGKDLFPENFIVTLDRPSNYFGALRVFGETEADEDYEGPIRLIKDRSPHLPERMSKGYVPQDVPESLIDAMRAFLIVKAIRLHRGQVGEHHSMLVNVSHLTAVQNAVRNRIAGHLRGTRAAITANAMLPCAQALRDPQMAAIRAVFDAEFRDANVTWSEVQPLLVDAVRDCTIIADNNKSSERLDYSGPEKVTVIAVGGFTLGRGLTLEGLSVSYFLRNSKAYDTLLQMGRWFGYRTGYEDLCRIWMTRTSQDWYTFIAKANEELRSELRRMERAKMSPEEFGLKVRSHPASLEVTARNKRGTSEHVVVNIDLVGKMLETAVVYRNPEPEAAENRDSLVKLVDSLEAEGAAWSPIGATTGRLYAGAPLACVRMFLEEWRNHKASGLTQNKPVLDHIDDRPVEFDEWDVAFIGTQAKANANGHAPVWSGLGFDLVCQVREPAETQHPDAIEAQRRRFSSRGITKIGMEPAEIEKGEIEFRRDNPDKKNIPDRAYCEHRTRPLLALHLIVTRSELDEPSPLPISAWTVAFPSSAKAGETVEYLANTTWLSEFDDAVDEDEVEYDEP